MVVNGDESEPGTFKDRQLMERDPHQMLEGTIITSYANGANHAFIYIRGEYPRSARRVQQAVEDAYAAGYLGSDILGAGSTWKSPFTWERAPTFAGRRRAF